MSLEVMGRVGGVVGIAALVAGVLIRRHGRRAVSQADLTAAVAVDPPGPEAEAVAGDKFDVTTWPEAEAVAEVDPWLVALSPDTEAETDVSELTEVQWRTKVIDRLADLQKGLEKWRKEDREQRRVPRFAWWFAWFLLGVSIVVVIFGIHRGLAAPAQYAAASKTQARIASLNNQIASIDNQIQRAPHAKAVGAKCARVTGDQAWLDCLGRADPTIAKLVVTLVSDQFEVQGDNYEVQGDNSNAHELEVEGPAVLAFGSAFLGAVLGWMVPQGFAGLSRR